MKFGLTTLPERKVSGSHIETFKMVSNYGRHFFNISPQTGIYSQGRFQKISLLTT